MGRSRYFRERTSPRIPKWGGKLEPGKSSLASVQVQENRYAGRTKLPGAGPLPNSPYAPIILYRCPKSTCRNRGRLAGKSFGLSPWLSLPGSCCQCGRPGFVTAMQTSRPIEVLAPATTANLGPGFDCLGMALDLWNRLEVLPIEHGPGSEPSVDVLGEGAAELPSDSSNLTFRAMQFLFDEAGLEMPPVRLRCHNLVPLSRGLGSSAAAIAAGLVAANALCGEPFSSREILEMAATIEGHPDNVAAAVMGGLQLVVSDGPQLYTAPIPVPDDIQAVLFIPDARIATADARAVLPSQVSIPDAVFNMGRAALLVAGMTLNRPEYLDVATQDKLHQPYRQPLFPAIKVILAAARDAGALGVFLSGSGSTILALTRGREMTVAYEMFEGARLTGVPGKLEITRPTALGTHVNKDQ